MDHQTRVAVDDDAGFDTEETTVIVPAGHFVLDCRIHHYARLVKTYHTAAGDFPALKGIDLQVDDGEFVAVIGKSGSGKTTLINCLSGLDQIDRGEVLLEGTALHKMKDKARTTYRAQRMGFVFQTFNLVSYLTALENVQIPLYLSGVKDAEQEKRAAVLLERVGLGDRLDHKPAELSVGQQQRVAAARRAAPSRIRLPGRAAGLAHPCWATSPLPSRPLP